MMTSDTEDLGQKLIREHDTITSSTQSHAAIRLPELEMHLWHITYRNQDQKYTGTSLQFDPRTTEITRKILTEAVKSEPIIVPERNSTLQFLYRMFQSWHRYFHRNGSIFMKAESSASVDIFDVDTFVDHIQSYILRDYDIQRLDHQPDTKHIEWKNLYWMGYTYHLHVTVSRGDHPVRNNKV
jgi:hypothetical protein